MIELIPYFAIAALCLGMIAAWILVADADRRRIQKELEALNPGKKPTNGKRLSDRVSANFLVALAASLFLAFAAVSANTIIENGRLRHAVRFRDEAIAKKALETRASEKESRELKAKIEEMGAEKALYRATIETLMKKEDVKRATQPG